MTDNQNILFSAIKIGSTTIKNRLVMPAIGTSFGDPNGHVTQELTSYYQNLARGGIGLMITENISVHPSGRTSPFMLNLHSDDYINGIKQLVSIAHENNAKIFLQHNHGGRQT